MQKKLLLAIAVVIAGFSSQAQVQKGNWVLGGLFSYSNYAQKMDYPVNTNQYSGSISLLPGFAVTNKTVIGLRAAIAFSGYKDQSNKSTSLTLMPGVYWNQYFPFNDKFGFYTHLEAGYDHVKYEVSTVGSPSYTTKGFDAGITPAFYFKLAKKMLLNASIGSLAYTYSKNSEWPHTKTSFFNARFFNGFAIGVDFILGKS